MKVQEVQKVRSIKKWGSKLKIVIFTAKVKVGLEKTKRYCEKAESHNLKPFRTMKFSSEKIRR